MSSPTCRAFLATLVGMLVEQPLDLEKSYPLCSGRRLMERRAAPEEIMDMAIPSTTVDVGSGGPCAGGAASDAIMDMAIMGSPPTPGGRKE